MLWSSPTFYLENFYSYFDTQYIIPAVWCLCYLTYHLTPLGWLFSHFDSCALFSHSVISLFPLLNSEFLENRSPHVLFISAPQSLKSWFLSSCAQRYIFICLAMPVSHLLPFEVAIMTLDLLLLPIVPSWNLASGCSPFFFLHEKDVNLYWQGAEI